MHLAKKRALVFIILPLILLTISPANEEERKGEEPMAKKKVFFPIRGVVEGFYGPPWSDQERLRLFDFFKECNFNLYIYAPKDDALHRAKWREFYTKEQLRKFKELVKRASENKIDFCWAISPGLSIRYSSEKDFQDLLKKCESINKLGVKWFALFLDDISPKLIYEEDEREFKDLSSAQVYLVNKLSEHLKKLDKDAHLIFCPTQYRGVKSSPYLETIGQGLSKDILIFWTGPSVCSPKIASYQAKAFGGAIKRKPLIWDNYPVNDYNRLRLFLGPIRNRSQTLYKEVSGLLSNPMNEGEASKIALYTIADYLGDPENYNPEKSWDEALRKVAGEDAYPYLKTLAENSQSSMLYLGESPLLLAKMGKFWKEYEKGKEYSGLKEEFAKFKELKENLGKSLKNKELLKEVSPYLDKLSLYGEAGELALLLLEKKRRGAKEDELLKVKRDLEEVWKRCLANRYQVCGKALDLFIRKARVEVFR